MLLGLLFLLRFLWCSNNYVVGYRLLSNRFILNLNKSTALSCDFSGSICNPFLILLYLKVSSLVTLLLRAHFLLDLIRLEWIFLLLLLHGLLKDGILNLNMLIKVLQLFHLHLFFIEFLLGEVGFLYCLLEFFRGEVSMPILCILESSGLDFFVGLVVVLDDIDWVLYSFS